MGKSTDIGGNPSRILPNLIIGGVNKAGTTSLYAYLARHPEICSSAVKETNYFIPVRYGRALGPIEEYARHFERYRGERYRMEASPGYFYGGRRVAECIQDTLDGDVRVLMLLREPVSRLISYFHFKQSTLTFEQGLSFQEYVDRCLSLSEDERNRRENRRYRAIDNGFYSHHMEDWLTVFGDRIKVLFFDDLQRDRKTVLRSVAGWLGIDKGIFEDLHLEVENRTIAFHNRVLHCIALSFNKRFERFWRARPALKQSFRQLYFRVNESQPSRQVAAETVHQLRELYAPYNRQLAEILCSHGYRELPKWLAET